MRYSDRIGQNPIPLTFYIGILVFASNIMRDILELAEINLLELINNKMKGISTTITVIFTDRIV